ncbi:MarC family protein [Thermosulfuriphilus sp.]
MIGFCLQVLMAFLAIMNPLGNTPIYLGLVEGFERDLQKQVARKAVTVAFFIVLIFALAGNVIFRLFGITLAAFRIAGGILVFLIAYHLLRGKRSRQHHPAEEEGLYEDGQEVAITPLGTPILAGPGTITTAMSYVGNHTDPFKIALIIGAFSVVCLLTYFCFLYAERVVDRIGSSWIGVMTRLMGLILAVIAVQMVIEGLKGAFPLLGRV